METIYNLPDEYFKIDDVKIPYYREFIGETFIQLPKIKLSNRVLFNTADHMKRRIELRNKETCIKNSWLFNDFETSDAIIYHPDKKRIKIDLDSLLLKDTTIKSDFYRGNRILNQEIYDKTNSEEYRLDLIDTSKLYSNDSIKNNNIIKILARDNELLKDYIDYISYEYKELFNKEIKFNLNFINNKGMLPQLNPVSILCVNRFIYPGFSFGESLCSEGNVHMGALLNQIIRLKN